MYLAIDVGGSKTLLAVFTPAGEMVHKHKFPTNPDYHKFLADLKAAIDEDLKNDKILHCCCGVPGLVDRKKGIIIKFGNLDWRNVPIAKDISKLLEGLPVLVENDACLAALSEAVLVHDRYKRVGYITLSTGIGGKIIIDGKINPDFADAEIGHMVLNYHGELTKWEDFASGRALFKKTGQKAAEITDPKIWKEYTYAVALGLQPLLPVWQPDVVIIGGGVGGHLDKFKPYLKENLSKFQTHMVKIPPIIKAKRPEEAVIYGCYELIKQQS